MAAGQTFLLAAHSVLEAYLRLIWSSGAAPLMKDLTRHPPQLSGVTGCALIRPCAPLH